MHCTRQEARRYLVHYHGLNLTEKPQGKDAVLSYFKRVGCIQYDPLNVVGRNPDLVLQARIQGYKPEILQEMLYNDRTLVDAWDKMMAIYPTEDWPYMNRVRVQREISAVNTLRHRQSEEALKLTGDLRELLEQEGPKQASKIKFGTANSGRWGHRKLSSAALDYMFHRGELGVHTKRNTQKVYDLIERLIPSDILEQPDPFASDDAFVKWYIMRRIGSVGLLWEKNGGGWLGYCLKDKKRRSRLIKDLVEEKELIPVSIEGLDDPFYMRAGDEPIFDEAQVERAPVMNFLAPLDNLMWDREMIQVLFDFAYSWEVYVPKAKRKFGYYVLPVLYGDRFVGRFEPEQQRGSDPLRIANWWWEAGVEVTPELEAAREDCLERFCGYLGADGFSV